MRHPFRRSNLRLRLLPLALAAVGLVGLARPTPRLWLAGAALVAGGATLRLWAAGHLVKTDRLTRSGPYGHLRHPLYVGSLLIGVGFGIAAGSSQAWILAGLSACAFLAYVLPYKERIEGARLERRFGAGYLSYRAAVPAVLPMPRAPRRFASAQRWSLGRARENDEFGVLLGVTLGLAVLALRGRWLL